MLSTLRPFIPTTLFALFCVYFGFQLMTGDRGLLGWETRDRLLAQRQVELAEVTAKRAELAMRVEHLRDDRLSADLLDERARILLGFADPRDYVVRIKQG